MPDPVIELLGISKNYGGLRPLRIESLSLSAGDHVAILGLDQPMAETFVNLVTGATLPERGEVRIFGRSTAAITDSTDWLAVVDRFGIVSARAVLLEGLSVMQNLSMPFTLDIEPPADNVRAKAGVLAREVGFQENDESKIVASLDDIGRARVRLGRALALDPGVLLLEHANAGLSRQESVMLGTASREIAIRRGIALVAATVDRDFAAVVASRLLTLEPATGRLAERRGGVLGRLFGP